MSWFTGDDKTSKKVKEEPEEEEEDENTYNTDVDCENCDCAMNFDIPKGQTIQVYVKNKKCENCGCNLIQPSDN